MESTYLPYDDWTPDVSDIVGGVTQAKNVRPHEKGYLPFNSLATTSSALTDYARGGASFTDKDGAVETYAGDETNLYRIASQTWADKSGSTYTTGPKAFWRFVKWGEAVIATNFTDAPQTKAFGAGTNFAALGGSPPKGSSLAVVRSFVVLGNIDDGTHYPSKVAWSGINAEATWALSGDAATQSDSQLLTGDGGAIQAITSGSVGVIVQERSIWEMTYEGPPVVFAFEETAPGLGTSAPQSVVRYGNIVYFLGNDGFYQYVIGEGPTPIGDKKIDLWFLNRVEKTNLHRMQGVVDIPNGKIVWAYPTGSGDCSEILIYDYKTGRWGYAEVDTQTIFAGRSTGYTMETIGAGFVDNIDLLPYSLDSDAYKGNVLALYGFDTAKKMGSFGGPALTASMETVEMRHPDDQVQFTTGARPLVQGGSAVNTMYVGTRDKLSDPIVYSSASLVNAIGEHNFREAGRYMRFRVETADGFEMAVGVSANMQARGIR